MQDTEPVMIPNELLMQSEIVQWSVGIGAAIAVIISSLKGAKAAKAVKSQTNPSSEATYALLKDFARLSADIETMNATAGNLRGDFHNLSDTLKILLEEIKRTYDKIDSIETTVEILKDRR